MTIIDLKEASDSEHVGGKAARLGDLTRIGVNVPNGFVVVPDKDGSIDESAAKEILHHFDHLDTRHVAVRSSTTVEDGSEASWAGQFDTFLFVNRDTLIDKIQHCIQSALSARSVAYAKLKGHAGRPHIAVIIQRMIPSAVSGVCFSVHPVTKDSNRIVIEAAYGLGEAVVSGEVTPDNYIVSRQPRNIVGKTIALQPKALVFSETLQKTTWVDTDNPQAQKLTDAQILELAVVTEQLERRFGYPVDIEWAFYKNKLYILQSRPITTL